MKIQNYQRYVGILRNELTVAMGCTEPAASALAGAKVSELLNGKVDRLIVKASKDMVKNAMGVGLPNCTLKEFKPPWPLGLQEETLITDYQSFPFSIKIKSNRLLTLLDEPS
ncbi:MAG: hypothetical protein WDA14_00010 [Sphaerochaetaceae bacterium]|nr:hypothetical protein [Sphaerochaetaceae bacterium]MDD4762998.1 hypothetical protein [Sphaerochaetaceae bacterium]MDD4840739.1 hypothetical protein [Sphaerochaetaceae bacterium]